MMTLALCLAAAITTRGVVLTPKDLSGELDWPKLAHDAGLTTIGTHVGPADVMPFLTSEKGRKFLADCTRYGIEVEHELHAMGYLLPRKLFDTRPELFRMEKDGTRVREQNCCASSPEALAIIASNAVEVARVCRPTTGRYFYWLDDSSGVCHCPKCRELNAADQALLIENAILGALRAKVDPRATLAHLAYGVTMNAPEKVKPADGIFLEFADIGRKRDQWLDKKQCGLLKRLLEVFPVETAQVLEYWLDVSLFSEWHRPYVKLPWSGNLFRRDVDNYAKLGFRKFTTFAVYLDDDYVRDFGGLPEVLEYGRGLREWPYADGNLFDGGRTDWKIRIPANAAKPVAYAAEELTNALFRVSGAAFPIEVSDAGVAEKTIALVAGDETETNEVSTVRTVSGGLLLKGNSPRGALYAAYDFLERELGCRWFWLGEEGTYLPKKAAFALPTIDRTSVTSFRWRGLFIPNGGGSEWMARNRVNGWTYDWKNIEKCGYVNVFGNHTVGITRADVKAHPEYEEMMALFDGETKRRGGAGCWTNPKFLEKMVDVNLGLVRKYGVEIMQPFPADVTQRCCCERCKAEGGDAKSAWWRFFAKLRKGMKARDPKLRFAGLAYQEYRDLPKELPGAEDLEFVDYAQYNRCYVHAADDPNCKLNKRSFDEMKGWSKLVNVGLYGYEFDIFSPQMYVPFWNMLADQMRTFKKIGLVDVHTEYSLKFGPRVERPQEKLRLPAWIYMRLLADADQPVEPLVREFCSYVYGAGADEMAAYHFAAAKAWDTQKAHYTYFLRKPDTAAGCFLNAALIREARTRFAAAKKAIADSADDAAAKVRALENVELDEAWFAEWEKLYKIATAGACSVAVADDTPWDACFASKMTSEKGRHQPTDVRVRATDAALEVRVTCTETNMSGLVRGPTGHDAKGIFGTDCLEIFIEPEDGVYRHFVVNAAGGQYDALLQNDATNWNWTVKTELGADRWTATLSIPWAVFGGGKPAKGATWKMVVDRESRPECCGFPAFVVHDLAGGASLYFCGKVPSGRSFVWFNSEGGNSYLIKDQLANGWNPKYVRYEDAPKTDLSEAPVIVVRMFHEVRKALSKDFYRNQLLPALTNGAIVVIGTYGAPEMWDWFGDPDLRIGSELYNLAVGCGMPGLFRADPKKWEWLDRNKTKKGEELPYLIRRPYGKGLLVLFMENPTVKVLNQQLEDFQKGTYRK